MNGLLTWVGADQLVHNTSADCHFWSRGYAVCPDGTCLTGIALGHYLASRRDQLSTIVPKLNGCFSAFLSDERTSVIITDRIGTIPIYLGRNGAGSWSVSDRPWDVIECLPACPQIHDGALVDLLHAGYVTGDKTLIEGVTTATPATITNLDGPSIATTRYWEYRYQPLPLSAADAVDALENVLRSTIKRSCQVLEALDSQPLLTLSGGLDSRLLAGLFFDMKGVQPKTLSYGDAADPEVVVAAEIANAVGFEHRTIPINKSYFNKAFVEQSISEVGITTRFTCGTGARHFTQVEHEVLIPGHTGDFISGGHLPPHAGLVGNRDQLHRFLDLRHFVYPHSKKILRHVLKTDPNRRFDSLAYTTSDFDFSHDMFGLIDRWNVENRQRRLILMEMRAYEKSAPWILPFYDYDLIDFFARIPHALRVGQPLYVKTAIERIFVGELEPLATIRRVGKPLQVDHSPYKKIEQFAGIPRALHTPILAAWPWLREMQQKLRKQRPMTQGPDPIRHWFQTDPDVRDFVIRKIQGITIDLIDTDKLIEFANESWVPDEFFNRLIPAAITSQETLDRARACWRGSKKKDLVPPNFSRHS